MSKHPVPDAAQVKDLLGFLFDGLAVKPAPKLDISPTSGNFLAVYIADDGSPVALCACNVAFAANAGAALSNHPGIDFISFTGSVEVGTLIQTAAARNHIVPG